MASETPRSQPRMRRTCHPAPTHIAPPPPHMLPLILPRLCQVYDTPNSHVTRDYQEARGQLGDLHFRVSDTSGLEPREGTQGGGGGGGGWGGGPAALQVRATALTARLLQQSHLALFVVDAKWVRVCGLGWGKDWLGQHRSSHTHVSTVALAHLPVDLISPAQSLSD